MVQRVSEAIEVERAAVGRAAAGMGLATAVSRVVGLGRVLVIAGVLGTSALGDAFGSANAFSNVLFELLAAGALSAVLVPTFVAMLDRSDSVEAGRLAGGLLWWASVALGTVSLIAVVGAPVIARLLTAGVAGEGAAEQRTLVTYLLRWFVPQVVLYAFGAVATALLYARRRFAITAAAPIANTIVIVVVLLAFRSAAGTEPGLDLDHGERLLLGLAGTGGVVGFVGVLVIAARREGFRVMPRRVPLRDAAFARLLRLGAWGVLMHSIVGLLLGAAIVLGASVRGGVIAYYSAFVLFLAPYAVLAQPLHTAVLPELASLENRGRDREWCDATRWTLGAIAKLVLPATAIAIAVAGPVLVAFRLGELDERGARMVAASFVGFVVGLLPYSAFLLFARACFSLGDSRSPALVAVAAGAVGVATMALGTALSAGEARLAWLGAGHSAAYVVGATALGLVLARRGRRGLLSADIARALAAAVVACAAAFPVARIGNPDGRGETLALGAIAVLAGSIAYLATMRLLGGRLEVRRRGAA